MKKLVFASLLGLSFSSFALDDVKIENTVQIQNKKVLIKIDTEAKFDLGTITIGKKELKIYDHDTNSIFAESNGTEALLYHGPGLSEAIEDEGIKAILEATVKNIVVNYEQMLQNCSKDTSAIIVYSHNEEKAPKEDGSYHEMNDIAYGACLVDPTKLAKKVPAPTSAIELSSVLTSSKWCEDLKDEDEDEDEETARIEFDKTGTFVSYDEDLGKDHSESLVGKWSATSKDQIKMSIEGLNATTAVKLSSNNKKLTLDISFEIDGEKEVKRTAYRSCK